MFDSILPADTFIVFNKTILTDADRKLLTMLYQPIIGSNAISLYFTFWSCLDKSENISKQLTHHHLMANMHIKIKEIIEIREKLEAVGLIRSYVKKGNINEFIYELYSPNTASEFFNNPILNTSLYNNIGDTEYKKIVEHFKISLIVTKDYEEITKSFHEIYKCIDNYVDSSNIDIKKKTNNKLKIEETIDIDTILNFIPEEMINHKAITKETKDLIGKLSYIYNYNEEQMINLIRNSINEKKLINKIELKNNCRKLYQFENSGKMPNIAYKSQPEVLRKKMDNSTKKNKMINQFETTSPYEFLCSKYKNNAPTNTDLDIVKYLMVELNFKPGVVNVLIDYVLKINNNNLTKAFVETIASQWGKHKIETVEDAMILAEKEYKLRKNYQVKNNKKEVVTPIWFNKEIKSKKASEEKKKEMEELLRDFR